MNSTNKHFGSAKRTGQLTPHAARSRGADSQRESTTIYALGETNPLVERSDFGAEDEDATTTTLLMSGKRKKRICCHRIFSAWILLLPLFLLVLFIMALVVARNRVSVSPDTEGPGAALAATEDFHIRLDVTKPSMSLRISKNLTIESAVPFTMHGITVNFLYTYEKITPKLILDPQLDSVQISLSKNTPIKLKLEHQLDLDWTDVYDVSDLRGAVLAMNSECEEHKTVTVTVLVSFCHIYASIFCRQLAATKMPLEVPCINS